MGGSFFGQAADGTPPVLVQAMPLILLGAVFYMMLVRPEQKRRRDHDQLVAGLKRNDQVVLASGIHGRVMTLADKTVTVEIAPRVQVVVDRSAVQTVEKSGGAEKPAAIEPREKEREKS